MAEPRHSGQVRTAARQTGRVLERSRVVVAVSSALREKRPVVQCVHCRRFGDGRGSWSYIDRLVIRPAEVSETLCPSCLAEHMTERPAPSEERSNVISFPAARSRRRAGGGAA